MRVLRRRRRPDAVFQAAQHFIDAGGRLMISPRGRFISVINSDLVITGTVDAQQRLEIAAAFRQARMAPGATDTLRYMVARFGTPADGWRVLGG